MSEHNAETQPDCRCPVPNRPTGREPEQLPPWECLTCGGYACEYADQSKARCPEWRCDCFIAQFPDSPRDLHPEVFIVGAIAPPDTPCPNCSHARGLHHDECTDATCGCDWGWDDFAGISVTPPAESEADHG